MAPASDIQGNRQVLPGRLVTPTQRSLARCRANGWPADVTERWMPVPKHPAGGVRRDLFHCIDVVALDGQPGVLGIQACAGASAAARVWKLRAIPEARAWLAARNRLEIWAWRKVGPAGKRKLWEVRVIPLELAPPEKDE